MGTTTKIALIGRSGTGKTTLARQLDWVRLAFGTDVKRQLGQHITEAAGLVCDDYYRFIEERKVQYRSLIQEFGDSVRELDPDVWIRPVRTRLLSETRPVVIDDMRYIREAEAMTQLGFKTVLVHGEFNPLPEPKRSHKSEREHFFIHYDYLIDNFCGRPPLEQLLEFIDAS